MNQTPNYQLSQWERTDKIQMDDFNADNAKIDAALKAEADARTAETSALTEAVAKLGNCGVYTTSYTGNGKYGPNGLNWLTFPKAPALVVLFGTTSTEHIGFLVQGSNLFLDFTGTAGAAGIASWSNGGRTVGWYTRYNNAQQQMNISGETYHVVALYSAG